MAAGNPIWIGRDRIPGLISPAALVAALREGFLRGANAAPRQHHMVADDGSAMLQMLAWSEGVGRVVKVMSAVPSNAGRGLPTSSEVLGFFHPVTGQLVAVIECAPLTLMRTAAASALAADLLAPVDASRLALIATGPLAPHLAAAHAAVRPLSAITVCGRDPDRAETAARAVGAAVPGATVTALTDIAAAVAAADIISCATRATQPVLRGAWLKPGAHVDLVGGYTPAMREADDDTLRGAAIWLDQRAAGMTEPGDIVVPLAAGVIGAADIRGDLTDLVRLAPAPAAGTRTVFKSVGCALEDLYAAQAVVAAALAAAGRT